MPDYTLKQVRDIQKALSPLARKKLEERGPLDLKQTYSPIGRVQKNHIANIVEKVRQNIHKMPPAVQKAVDEYDEFLESEDYEVDVALLPARLQRWLNT